MWVQCKCVYRKCVQLGNGTGHITVTMVAPLLLFNGQVRYNAVLHSCGTSPVAAGVAVHPHGDLIMLPHWNTRPLATMTTEPPYPDTDPASPIEIMPQNQARERQVLTLKALL